MSTSSREKESDDFIVYGHSLRSAISLPAQSNGTSRTFRLKIAIFPQFQVYLSITQAKEMINLLLLNSLYPVICRRVDKESDELFYTVWSLVMVRNQFASAMGSRRNRRKTNERVMCISLVFRG